MATLVALVAMAHMQADVALCAQETALIMMALQLAEDAQQAYTMEVQQVDAPTHHRLVVAVEVVATLHLMVAVTVATPHQVAVQEAVATQVVVAAVADSLAAVTVAAVVASVAAEAEAATEVAAVTADVDNIAHERA